MTTVLREALAGALHHVRGETQAGACPGCEAVETGSRGACRLVLDALDDATMTQRYHDHGGMCLVHVLQTLPVADPPTLKVLAGRLQRRLHEEVGPPLVGVLAGSDDDARRRALWRLPDPPRRGSTVDRLREAFEIEACPVCLSACVARERYERCHGLCVRHAMRMSDGHAARVARRHLDARMSVLAWEVGETARKYAWAYRHETSGPEDDAWTRALAQIDGRVFAGAPAPAGQAPDSPEAE